MLNSLLFQGIVSSWHDDVIKWKHFPRYWPFVRGIHRSPVNSPHKGQWRGALIFSLICVWINGWVNNQEAGDLRRYRVHYDVSVMTFHVKMSDFSNFPLFLSVFVPNSGGQICVSNRASGIFYGSYCIITFVLNPIYPQSLVTDIQPLFIRRCNRRSVSAL